MHHGPVERHWTLVSVLIQQRLRPMLAIFGCEECLLAFDGIIASRDGVPSIDEGVIIGAIGVSGGTDSQDEVVSGAGAAVVYKLSRLREKEADHNTCFLTTILDTRGMVSIRPEPTRRDLSALGRRPVHSLASLGISS